MHATEKKVQFGCRNNANIDVCTPSKKACKCVSDWRANLKKIGVCKPHFSLSESDKRIQHTLINDDDDDDDDECMSVWL